VDVSTDPFFTLFAGLLPAFLILQDGLPLAAAVAQEEQDHLDDALDQDDALDGGQPQAKDQDGQHAAQAADAPVCDKADDKDDLGISCALKGTGEGPAHGLGHLHEGDDVHTLHRQGPAVPKTMTMAAMMAVRLTYFSARWGLPAPRD